MTAQRRRLARQKLESVKKLKSFMPLLIIFLGTLIAISLLAFLYFRTFIDQESYTVSSFDEESNAEIKIYNFKNNTITSLFVPKDTQVRVAKQRGNLRLSSVKKIIETENESNDLLKNSLMKTFGIPIDKYDENFDILKRIKLYVFSFSAEKQLIDLKEEKQISLTKLQDSEDGYVFNGSFSPFIRQIIYNREVGQTRVEIVRRVDTNYEVSEDVSEVLTNIGMHVISIKKEDVEDIDCIIETDQKETFNRIASVFECDIIEKVDGNQDAKIIIGNKFAKRF